MFKQYDGKKIKFHKDGPFIDSEGVIHLKAKPGQENQEVALSAKMFNVNVQSKKLKDQEGFHFKLIEMARNDPSLRNDPEFNALKEKAAQGKCAPHEIAEDFALFLHKKGKALSLGCMSVKDRTLAVSEGLSLKSMKDKIPKKEYENLQENVWGGITASSMVLIDDTRVLFAKYNPTWIGSQKTGTKIDFAVNIALQTLFSGASD